MNDAANATSPTNTVEVAEERALPLATAFTGVSLLVSLMDPEVAVDPAPVAVAVADGTDEDSACAARAKVISWGMLMPFPSSALAP